DQTPGGHHHPAAILLADRIHPPEPGHEVALLDLDNSHPAFDQSGAAMDIAHDPSLHPRFRRRLIWPIRVCWWRRRDRARDFLGLCAAVAARHSIEHLDGFVELGRRLSLNALDAFDALANPGELGAG